MKKFIQKTWDSILAHAPFLTGLFLGMGIVLYGFILFRPDPPQYDEVRITTHLTIADVEKEGIGFFAFNLLHNAGYTLIKTTRLDLIAEIEDRLDDPETEQMTLRLVKENDHSLWGEPGWRLSVQSEYIKTYQ